MKILVTGANSPLGLAVCQEALGEGHDVSGTFRTTVPSVDICEKLSRTYIVDLERTESVHSISGLYDAVIHVASASEGSPESLLNVNGVGTLRLINKAIELGVRKFVHVSSMSVYGNVQSPIVDWKTTIDHTTPYGLSKWAAECYCKMSSAMIDVVSVRSPAIVGKTSHRHFLAKTLQSFLRQDSFVTLYNPDFKFNNVVHETVQASFLLDLCLNKTTPSFKAFPIASCDPIPLKSIIDVMVLHTSFSGKVNWQRGNTLPFSIDNRAAEDCGYTPISTLETIEKWMSEQRSV